MYFGMLLAPFPEQTNKSSVTLEALSAPPPNPLPAHNRGKASTSVCERVLEEQCYVYIHITQAKGYQ